MKTLSLIEASITFDTLIKSLKYSIEEIEKKSPHRTDLIESMSYHLKHLHEAFGTFRTLQDENKILMSELFDLKRKLMEMEHKLSIQTKVNDGI